MEIAALFLRALDTNGAIYEPCLFKNINDKDEKIITACLSQFVPNKVDSMFNFWIITNTYLRYTATRSTWTRDGMTDPSVNDLCEQIISYYTRFE